MPGTIPSQAVRDGAPNRGVPTSLELVLDELAYGVAVTTGAGDLVHANHAARHELGRQ